MRKIASWIVLAIGLIPLWLVSSLFFGARTADRLILFVLAYGLSVVLLALAARKVSARGWLVAGLLILAGLFVPTSVLTDNLGNPASLSETIFQITVFLLPSIGLIMAAVLLYSGFSLLQEVKYPAADPGAGSQTTQDTHARQSKVSLVMRWLGAGLLLLAGILVPIIVLPDNLGNPAGLFGSILQIGVLLLPCMALIMAAVLLFADNKSPAEVNNPAAGAGSPTAPKNQGKLAFACFVLSGLLLLKTLHNLYWLTVWDTTYDPLGYIWIVVPVLAAFFSGVILFINLRRWTVWVGLGYLLFVPGLIMAVSTTAQQVDFRQLTEAHAEQVSQRVEAYYARQGRYPQELQQVKPWYAASLPEPFIMYGQDWCYLAGEDYYQLGYVYREHWSSPELIRRLYKSSGEPPESAAICAEEISALIQQESIFYEK